MSYISHHRSHTKSRKGCETCKRRHIRCDENFPQWYVSEKAVLRTGTATRPRTDCVAVEIAQSIIVAVLTWICQCQKNVPRLLRRRICCGLPRSKPRLNGGSGLEVSHSQTSTSTHRRHHNFSLSRIFASFTMSPRSRANSACTTPVTSQSGHDKFRCKWHLR